MDAAPRITATPAAPGPLSSFARFVLFGGGIGVLSSAAVPLVAGLMPWVVANAVITVVSTLLCTELHARFTFGTGRRAGWRQHWQSAGSATAAYVVTCVAMFILHAVQSSPGMLTEQIVYLSASGLAGIGRFVVLRVFVFAGGRARTAAPVRGSLRPAVGPAVPVFHRVDGPFVTALSGCGPRRPRQGMSYRRVLQGASAHGLTRAGGRHPDRGRRRAAPLHGTTFTEGPLHGTALAKGLLRPSPTPA